MLWLTRHDIQEWYKTMYNIEQKSKLERQKHLDVIRGKQKFISKKHNLNRK